MLVWAIARQTQHPLDEDRIGLLLHVVEQRWLWSCHLPRRATPLGGRPNSVRGTNGRTAWLRNGTLSIHGPLCPARVKRHLPLFCWCGQSARIWQADVKCVQWHTGDCTPLCTTGMGRCGFKKAPSSPCHSSSPMPFSKASTVPFFKASSSFSIPARDGHRQAG